MLVLSRRTGQSIWIADNIKLTVIEIKRKTIKLGISAPEDMLILREEVRDKIQNKKNNDDT